MADKTETFIKKAKSQMDDTKKAADAVYTKYNKEVKKANKGTNDLAESFKVFRKVMDGISTKGFSETLNEMPNYVKGVSKLSAAFQGYNKEVDRTSKMLKYMGISYNKTMKELENKSSGAAKSMSDLVTRANKLASLKDSLLVIPKRLKDMKGAMGDVAKVDTKDVDQLQKMLKEVRANMSKVDFEDLKGKIKKLGTDVDTDDLAKSIQESLSDIDIISNIEGGPEAAKKLIESISSEVDKIKNLKPGDVLITDFIASLKTLKDDDSMSSVIAGHKKSIEELEKGLATPGVTYEETAEKIIDLNKKISDSIDSSMSDFGSQASKFSEEVNNLKKDQEALSDKIQEGYDLTINTESAVADIGDVLSHLKASAFSIQARGIIPNEELMKTKELQDGYRLICELNEENKSIQQDLLDGKVKSKEELDDLVDKQKDNTAEIRKQVKAMGNLSDGAANYADNLDRGSKKGFGEQKAEGMSNELFKMSGFLKKAAGSAGSFGGKLDWLAGKAEGLGGKLGAIAFPIGIVAGAITVTKALLKLESQFHALNKEIMNTGAMANVSAENATSSFRDLNLKMTNTSNLAKAAFGGNEFALGREDIIGMTAALREGGVAIYDLKKRMKGVHTTAGGVKNEFAGAAGMVATFSTEMGIAPGIIAQSIGEMTYDYNENLKGIQDTYSEISAASKNSGMSQTRFLAAVQTSTAGLSIYEDQVAAVAKIIGSLGKDEAITGKAAETLAKNMTEFSTDATKVALGFTQMGPAQKTAMKDAVAADLAITQAKISNGEKLTKEEENKFKMRKEWLKKASSGDWGINQAAQVEMLGGGAQAEVYAASFDALIKAADGNYFAMKEMAGEFGLSKEAVTQAYKSTGGDVGKITDHLRSAGKAATKQQGDIGKQTKNSLDKFNKSNDPRNKLLDSLWKTLLAYAGAAIPLLMTIAAGTGGLGALKGMKGLFGKGASKGISSAVGVAKTAFQTGGVKGLLGAGARGGLNVAKILGTTLLKVLGPLAAVAAAGFAGFKIGEWMMNTELGQAFSDKGSDVIKGISDWLGFTKSDDEAMAEGEARAKKGIDLRRGKELITANAERSGKGMEEFKSYDELRAFRKKTIAAKKLAAMPGQIQGGAVIPGGAPIQNLQDTVLAKGGANAATITNTDGSSKVTNTNHFNINGGNPQEVERVIMKTLVSHENSKR